MFLHDADVFFCMFQCSKTCGTGFQYREVICRRTDRYNCSNRDKPTTNRFCYTNVPCIGLKGTCLKLTVLDKGEMVDYMTYILHILLECRFKNLERNREVFLKIIKKLHSRNLKRKR